MTIKKVASHDIVLIIAHNYASVYQYFFHCRYINQSFLLTYELNLKQSLRQFHI